MRSRNHVNIVPIIDKSYVRLFKYELKNSSLEIENDYWDREVDQEKEPMMIQSLAVCEGIMNKKFACNHCPKHFKIRGNLNRHIRTVHEGIKFTCDECDKQFASKQCLNRHIQSVHEGII